MITTVLPAPFCSILGELYLCLLDNFKEKKKGGAGFECLIFHELLT